MIGGPGGGERGRQRGLMEELESLVWATRTRVATGDVRFESVSVRNGRSPSACSGTLMLHSPRGIIFFVFFSDGVWPLLQLVTFFYKAMIMPPPLPFRFSSEFNIGVCVFSYVKEALFGQLYCCTCHRFKIRVVWSTLSGGYCYRAYPGLGNRSIFYHGSSVGSTITFGIVEDTSSNPTSNINISFKRNACACVLL